MPSALKEKLVKKLNDDLQSSAHVIVTEYQGMTAEQFDAVRAALRPYGAKYTVVKNRLAKLSLEKNGFGDLKELLKGPSAIAYQGSDGAAILKALFKVGETNNNFKVKAGKVMGITADLKSLKAIADLPSREVLLATLLARLNGPLTSLVTTLNEPMRSLHSALSALAKKKESVPA